MQNTTARVLLSASKHLRLNNIHHFNRSQATLARKQDLPHLQKLFCPRRPKISSCTSPVIHQQVKICTSSLLNRSSLRTHASLPTKGSEQLNQQKTNKHNNCQTVKRTTNWALYVGSSLHTHAFEQTFERWQHPIVYPIPCFTLTQQASGSCTHSKPPESLQRHHCNSMQLMQQTNKHNMWDP